MAGSKKNVLLLESERKLGDLGPGVEKLGGVLAPSAGQVVELQGDGPARPLGLRPKALPFGATQICDVRGNCSFLPLVSFLLHFSQGLSKLLPLATHSFSTCPLSADSPPSPLVSEKLRPSGGNPQLPAEGLQKYLSAPTCASFPPAV